MATRTAVCQIKSSNGFNNDGRIWEKKEMGTVLFSFCIFLRRTVKKSFSSRRNFKILSKLVFRPKWFIRVRLLLFYHSCSTLSLLNLFLFRITIIYREWKTLKNHTVQTLYEHRNKTKKKRPRIYENDFDSDEKCVIRFKI